MPFPAPQHAETELPEGRLPGMGEKDDMILRALIERTIIRPVRLWFNTVVGNVEQSLIDSMPPERREWVIATYSKRPDVIYEENGTYYVGEVKPYGSYVALGQAMVYGYHANQQPEPLGNFIPVILTDIPDPDVIVPAALAGVEIRQLGEFTQFRPKFAT